MKNTRFSILFGIITISYILPLILPILGDKRFGTNSEGEISLLPDGDRELRLLEFEGSLMTVFVLLLAALFSILSIVRLNRDKNPGYFSILSTILGFYGYIKIDQFRSEVISASYVRSTNFENVSPYKIGLWILLFGILLNFLAVIYSRYYQTTNLREIFIPGFKSNAKGFYGPTFIIYLSIHIVSILAMVLGYGQYAGWGQAIKGPAYYQNAILTFGLNRNGDPLIGKDDILISYLLAPFLVITIGLSLFFLSTAGFAPNGPGPEITAVENRFYQGTGEDFAIWGYFSEPIPGANEYLGNSPKATYFYLLIVFLPIILGSIIGAIVNIKLFGTKKSLKFFNILKFYAVISWISAWLMANATAPVYVQPAGIYQSLFMERFKDNNQFIRYRFLQTTQTDFGAYHPLSIFWFALILLIIVAIFNVVVSGVVNGLATGKLFEKKESAKIKGKFFDESITNLPFNKNKDTNKVQE